MFEIRPCPLARLHHGQSIRSYAHVFHRRNTICVTPHFYDLPQGFQVGILLHELGHIALANIRHSEEQADNIASVLSGVTVRRRVYSFPGTGEKARNLEYVRKADIGAALRFIREFTR